MQELMKTCLAHCWPALLGAAVIAYLLGSVNFAIIVTRLMSKKDIRDFGSGNAGRDQCTAFAGAASRHFDYSRRSGQEHPVGGYWRLAGFAGA